MPYCLGTRAQPAGRLCRRAALGTSHGDTAASATGARSRASRTAIGARGQGLPPSAAPWASASVVAARRLFWTLYNLFASRSAGPDGTLATEVVAAEPGRPGLFCSCPANVSWKSRPPCVPTFPTIILLVAELCDSGPGYIVTPDALEGGGYEAEAALCDPGAAQSDRCGD